MIDFSQLTAAIDIQRDGAAVIIQPRLQNPVPLALRYALVVRREGPGGTADIRQQGNIETGTAASSVRLSLPPGASCSVHLEVLDGDVPVKVVDKGCESE